MVLNLTEMRWKLFWLTIFAKLIADCDSNPTCMYIFVQQIPHNYCPIVIHYEPLYEDTVDELRCTLVIFQSRYSFLLLFAGGLSSFKHLMSHSDSACL